MYCTFLNYQIIIYKLKIAERRNASYYERVISPLKRSYKSHFSIINFSHLCEIILNTKNALLTLGMCYTSLNVMPRKTHDASINSSF